jgi:hypothetical protein
MIRKVKYRDSKRYIFNRTKKLPEPELKQTSTIDHKAYVYYKDHSKLASRKTVKHYVDYGKTMTEFYKIVEEHTTRNLNGVFIERLGYFGVCIHAYSMIVNKWVKTDRHAYFLSFVPISTYSFSRIYTMELTFTKRVRRLLTKKIKEGYSYRFSPGLFYHYLRANATKHLT